MCDSMILWVYDSAILCLYDPVILWFCDDSMVRVAHRAPVKSPESLPSTAFVSKTSKQQLDKTQHLPVELRALTLPWDTWWFACSGDTWINIFLESLSWLWFCVTFQLFNYILRRVDDFPCPCPWQADPNGIWADPGGTSTSSAVIGLHILLPFPELSAIGLPHYLMY